MKKLIETLKFPQIIYISKVKQREKFFFFILYPSIDFKQSGF